MCDFSGFVQERHPFEMGGQFYTANLVWCQLSGFIFAFMYTAKYDGEDKIDSEIVWIGIISLALLWGVSYGAFLKSIKPEYRGTFFNNVTSHEHTRIQFFRENATDAQKFDAIFSNSDR